MFVVPPKCQIKTSTYFFTNKTGTVFEHPLILDEILETTFAMMNVKQLKIEQRLTLNYRKYHYRIRQKKI